MRKNYIKIIISVFLCVYLITCLNQLVKNTEYEKNLYIELSSEEIALKQKQEENLIVYYFKKDCMPCSLFKEHLNNQIDKYGYKIYAINIMNKTNSGEFLDNSNIEYTPTLIKFKNGVETKRLEGNNGEKNLSDFLKY